MTPPIPGTISQVVAQEQVRRHLGRRVNVFVDGRFSFALAAELAFQHGLRPGLTLEEEQLKLLLREDGDSRAYVAAMRFIGHRPRSSQEIRRRLAREELTDDVIDRVIERLVREKWVDDGQFAQEWVRARSNTRPRGAGLLKQELRQKGVGKAEIEASLPEPDQEVQNAANALRPRLRRLGSMEERDERQKAIAFLQRRGFNYSVAKAALALLAEEEEL